MSARAAVWAAGLGGSVLAHALMLGALSVAMRPQPVQQQRMPAGALDVQAYRLDRARAAQHRPAPTSARPATAQAAAMSPGSAPRTRARPASAPAAALPAVPAPVVPGGAVPPQAETLPDAIRAAAISLNPSDAAPSRLAAHSGAPADLAEWQPPRQPVPATAARPRTAPAASGQTQALHPRAPPEARVPALQRDGAAVLPPAAKPAAPVPARPAPSPRVPGLRPDTAPLPRLRAPTAPAAAIAPATDTVPAARRRGDPIKAALAFAGAGTGEDEIDPVSLAAFQSLLRPGAAAGAADGLRDGISALLAQVPCARLQVGFDPDSATLRVKGHVPQDDLRAPVLAALRTRMGADIAVSDRILILPRPQCGALSGIADVGLPQSTDQITNPLLIGADTHTRVLDFVKDERLYFDLTAPDYDAYVYVDYFDAQGNVLHLVPNHRAPLRPIPARTRFRVGTRDASEPGLQIFIGPPYGQEIAVAFAASAPLYDGLRPLVEPAADYLDWLRDRVAAARGRHPDFKGEWVYFFVTTAER